MLHIIKRFNYVDIEYRDRKGRERVDIALLTHNVHKRCVRHGDKRVDKYAIARRITVPHTLPNR